MSNDLLIPDNQSGLYKKMMNEWSSPFISIPTVKVSYEEDSLKKFVSKKGEETTILGDTFKGVIMKVAHQYRYFDKPNKTLYTTNEFANFNEPISFGKRDTSLISGDFKTVKAFIKSDYPDAKFCEIMYVSIEDTVYKFIITPASVSNLWDYQKLTTNKAPFSFVTEFSTGQEKTGLVTYFPVKFKKVEDLSQEDFKKYFGIRVSLDDTLDKMNNGGAVIEKEDIPVVDIEKEDIPVVDTDKILEEKKRERDVSDAEILDMLK